MTSWKMLLASTLLALLIASHLSQALDSGNSRALLSKKKKASSAGNKKDKEAAAEKIRERKAQAAYAKYQAAREKEKTQLLKLASKQSEKAISNFSKAENERAQINVFVNLWKNSAGSAVLKTITYLLSSSDTSTDYYLGLVAESIESAIAKGYATQVSAGVASALTIVEKEEDGGPLLNTILIILQSKNREKKGTGCSFVKDLMSDAELNAIQNGYEMEFTLALDIPRYLPIMECFLDACKGAAFACCRDEDAIVSGFCGCETEESRTCDFNIFWRQPRPIWRCNGVLCVSSKCLCPVVKARQIKVTKTKGKTPASTGSKAKAPASTGSKAKAPASTGSKAKAPASTGSKAKAPASTGSKGKTPASTGSKGKTPASTGSKGKTPASTGSKAKAPASTGSKSKTPASTGSKGKTPASTGSKGKTPASTGSKGKTTKSKEEKKPKSKPTSHSGKPSKSSEKSGAQKTKNKKSKKQ